MIYRLQYYSALDNAVRKRGVDLYPQSTDLIAPSGWCLEQVEQAFLQHHCGAALVSCTPIEHLDAA